MTSLLLQLLDRFTHTHPLPEPLPSDPFPLVRAWFDEAVAGKKQPNPNCMYLATATPDGRPSCRTVLCRGIDAAGGSLEFYTNYDSRKGGDLNANPRASVLFHWDAADRQVRVEGRIVKTTEAESDAYFNSRAWDRRLGSWASDQSRPIASRKAMLDKIAGIVNQHKLDVAKLLAGGDVKIPRPAHWGGYRLWAERVELWQGGVGRVHDRAHWTRDLLTAPAVGVAPRAGPWASTRLQP